MLIFAVCELCVILGYKCVLESLFLAMFNDNGQGVDGCDFGIDVVYLWGLSNSFLSCGEGSFLSIG